MVINDFRRIFGKSLRQTHNIYGQGAAADDEDEHDGYVEMIIGELIGLVHVSIDSIVAVFTSKRKEKNKIPISDLWQAQ